MDNFDRIGLIKLIREMSNAGLKEARDLIDSYNMPAGETDEQREKRLLTRKDITENVVIPTKHALAMMENLDLGKKELLDKIQERDTAFQKSQHEIRDIGWKLEEALRDRCRAELDTTDARDRLNEAREERDSALERVETLEYDAEMEKRDLQKNLKFLITHLFRDEKMTILRTLLDMLSPETTTPNDDSDIPF